MEEEKSNFLKEIINFDKKLNPTETVVKENTFLKVMENEMMVMNDGKVNSKKNQTEKEKEEKERLGGSIQDCHGVLGDKNWARPYCVAKSNEPNRKDQGNMTSSSEYLDEPEVLEKKMELIAQLIKKSKCVIAYTGAGLSRAAGIGDYGSKAKNSIVKNVKELKNPLDAKPTYAHNVISKMEENGLLHYYVQQNHDGRKKKKKI